MYEVLYKPLCVFSSARRLFMTSLLDVAVLYVDVVRRALPKEWPVVSLTGGVGP